MIGTTLQKLINEKGTNVNELSRAIGVSAQTLYSIIKRDNMKIDFDILLKICDTLSVDVGVFYKEYIKHKDCQETVDGYSGIAQNEYSVIQKYRRLNDSGKEYIGSQLDFALGIDKYRAQEQTEDKKHTALDEYRAHPPIMMGIAAFGGESSMETVSEEEHARRKASLENYRKNR